MAINWTIGGGMRPAGCLPCCVVPQPPSECTCALLIPPINGVTPYSDYASAQAGISADVSDCYFYHPTVSNNYDSASFDWTPEVASVSASKTAVEDGGFGVFCYISVSLKAGSTLSLNYSENATGTDPEIEAGAGMFIYSCLTGELVFSDSNVGGTSVSGTFNYSVPNDDTYIVLMSASTDFSGGGTSGGSATFSLYSDDTMTANPVIAIWDDSGTPRQLWACPKLILPPLTEDTGDWYVNCATAATAITNLTSNCVGYVESKTNVTTFTATDGGTSLTLALVLTVGATSAPIMWGGVNAVNGETVTITATAGLGTPSLNATIYDDLGVLVEASGSVATPWTSSALPYNGRYTIKVTTTSTLATVAMAAAITSSGALSVNPIQAVYATDPLLSCPARLNCGDSCPT